MQSIRMREFIGLLFPLYVHKSKWKKAAFILKIWRLLQQYGVSCWHRKQDQPSPFPVRLLMNAKVIQGTQKWEGKKRGASKKEKKESHRSLSPGLWDRFVDEQEDGFL